VQLIAVSDAAISDAEKFMQNTSYAVMAQCAEGMESLDKFPTPPLGGAGPRVEKMLGSDKVREVTCLGPELD
jgi:hypothetical protein